MSEVNENALTPERRNTITHVVKTKISKSKEKVKKNKNRFLREAFKALSKNPDKKAVAIGKVIKTKTDMANKLHEEMVKKLNKFSSEAIKAQAVASKETGKKVNALYKELDKKMKAIAKTRKTKAEAVSKPTEKKVNALQAEVEKNKEKLEKVGYKFEADNKKLVRPLYRKDEQGNKELGGCLAEPIRDEARAKIEALDDLADEAEVITQLNGTSVNEKLQATLAEANEIVNA